MIINKSIKIKISKKNIQHYIIFFPNIKIKDIITIDVEKHLQKNSNIKINVECDICKEKRFIKYQAYTKNLNSSPDHYIYTCDKCSHIKIKSFNKKKYGVDYFSKTEEYKEKFKSTMIERYGVEYALQSPELKNKMKQSNMNKFGVENPFQSEEIKEKIKQTTFDKYGVDHIQQIPEIKEKIKQTCIDKYGVEYALQSEEIRKKVVSTNLSKYGVKSYSQSDEYKEKTKEFNLLKYGYEWSFQSPIIKDKLVKTNLEKYGVDNPMKSEEVRKNMIVSKDPSYIKYIGDSISLFNCQNGHEFGMNVELYHSRKRNNTPMCTICYPVGNTRSCKEDDLYKFISSIYQGEIIRSYRDRYEIDIYIPEFNLGFEFNGLWYHSEIFKEKYFHINKTNYFKERGIRVIHIWEDDWDNKKEIIKSQILNWLGLTQNKIYARNCEVKFLENPSVCKKFLIENHIQGFVRSILRLGLYHKDELIGVMIFDHSEGRKKISSNEWNLSRFCNKKDTIVIGGASKMLKWFVAHNQPKRIVSYADKDWSEGEIYYKLGFSLVYETRPDYKYFLENRRMHKSKFRKSRLKTKLSESDFMKNSGIPKIWDCGKMKFEILIGF